MMNKINYTFPDFMQYFDHHFLYMSNRKWSSRKRNTDQAIIQSVSNMICHVLLVNQTYVYLTLTLQQFHDEADMLHQLLQRGFQLKYVDKRKMCILFAIVVLERVLFPLLIYIKRQRSINLVIKEIQKNTRGSVDGSYPS